MVPKLSFRQSYLVLMEKRMASTRSLITSLLLVHLSTFLNLTSFGSTHVSLSSTASEQIKFWSENVHNQMPESISKKLSPLTKKDRDYYTKMVSKNEFSENPSFCIIAKLSCSFVGGPSPVQNTYNCLPFQSNEVDLFSYFRLSILREGSNFHISGLEESTPNRAFLPQQIASKFSLSRRNIRKLFPKSFKLSKKSIETTLYNCNAEAIKGEIKNCTKSLEEMISFSKFALGSNKLLALASQITKTGEFLIKRIKTFDRRKIVSCHEVYLPFATNFCHSITSSRIYAVDLVEAKTQLPVKTVISICHMDTSAWPVNHVAFKILKFSPGEGEACHWMSNIDLAFIADD